MKIGLGEGECYCQPDIGWTCHHHENAPVPHNPKEDEQAVRAVLALRHRDGSRHSCRCAECRAIVRVAVMARERIAMGGKRQAKRKHRADAELGAALRAALATVPTGVNAQLIIGTWPKPLVAILRSNVAKPNDATRHLAALLTRASSQETTR